MNTTNPRNRRTARPLLLGGFCAIIISGLAGCGPGNPLGRVAVSGRVTLAGQPLEIGNIEFIPEKAGSVSSGAVIQAGQYSIDTIQGLPPGRYQVRIFSSKADPSPPTPEQAMMSGLPRPGVERVPPRYNMQTTLTAEVQAGQPAKFDFDLQGQ